jgi:hypothetical protein
MKKSAIFFGTYLLIGISLLSGCGKKIIPQNMVQTLEQKTPTDIALAIQQLPLASTTGMIASRGYAVTYEPSNSDLKSNVLTFVSPNGKKLELPKTVADFLNDVQAQRHVTSLDAPVEEKNPNSLYLSTNQPLDTNFVTLENHIYRYNLLTRELISVYEEKTTDSTMLRTIGRDGNYLLLLRENINKNPGACTSVWYDFRNHIMAFDPTQKNAELKHYHVPSKKLTEAYYEVQTCIAGSK